MSPLLPFALGIAASLSTYAGGVLAMRFKGPRELIFGLTGGFVIGLALLDLLPEALESGKGLYDATTIIGTLVAGLGLYLLLHRLPAGGAVGRLTLLLHSLMEASVSALLSRFPHRPAGSSRRPSSPTTWRMART